MPARRPNAIESVAAARSLTRTQGGACYLGRTDRPVYSPPEHGVLVLGPPRSGKTSSIVVPNVLAADGPVVVASTKRDVLDATGAARALNGAVAVFDPSGTVELPWWAERVGWSPVASARTWDRAVLIADAMVGASRGAGANRGDQAHWNERAGALLAPLLHAAALEGAPMAEVVKAVNRRTPDEFVTSLTNRERGSRSTS